MFDRRKMLIMGISAAPFYVGANVALDFTLSKYRVGTGVKRDLATLPGWTFTRASAGYAETAAGALVAFASGAPRITDKGLLIEEARTNVVLWNRDLTNAAWVHVNMTAAKDQTGPDGIANSASSLTAGAANSTSLQTIVLASSARFDTAYVKRITGSGVVEMTMDAGVTWTPITIPATWGRVSIPTQTLANPVVGFRIVTSGDAIAVDFVQNENGAFATSPIATTTASATRATDVATITGLSVSAPYTIIGKYNIPSAAASSRGMFELDDGTANNATAHYSSASTPVALCREATVNTAVITGSAQANLTPYIFGARWAVNDAKAYLNGAAMGADTALSPTAVSRLQIGVAAVLGGASNSYHERIVIYPTAFTDAQLQAATA